MKKYIHELSDWPRLTWRPDAVAEALERTIKKQGLLLGRAQGLGFDVDAANLEVVTQDVLNTSAIEGENFDPEQVRSSVARHLGIDTGLPWFDNRPVDGVVEMLLDATGRCTEPLTADCLFRWHTGLFPYGGWSGAKRIVVGQWRNGGMQVSSGLPGNEQIHFEAPGPDRVEKEMEDFILWFEEGDGRYVGAIVKSALAHLYFVTIHPFDDGNGRIARAIADMMLARADGIPGRFYSMSSQIAREKRDYWSVLEATQKGTLDVTEWVSWYLGCLERALDNSENTVDRVLLRARIWQRLTGVAVNERQRKMLNALLGEDFRGSLNAEKWAKMTKASKPTAVRDINELLEQGVLVREGAGRSTNYRVAD